MIRSYDKRWMSMIIDNTNCIDPQRRHIRSYVYLSEDQFLSKYAFDFVFFVLGIISFNITYILFSAYPEEGGFGLIIIGIICMPLGACLIARRKTILITNGILKITNYLKFFNTEKIFKVHERPMKKFEAEVMFDQAAQDGSSRLGTVWLHFNDGYSHPILYFDLKYGGQALFLSIIKHLENIIGAEIHIKNADRRQYGLEPRELQRL